MKLILDCFNLIGDSLYLLKPVERFLCLYAKDVVGLVVHPGLAHEMYFNSLGIEVEFFNHVDDATKQFPEATVLHLSAGQAGDYAFNERNHVSGKSIHISEAYAALLGIDLKGDFSPSKAWTRVDFNVSRDIIAVSPFSRSCTRHSTGIPNKTLDEYKWENIIRYLRRQDKRVIVLAGPGDVFKTNSVPLDDYFTASSLLELELFLKSCALLVTVDNGLGHIASVLDTPMISLWPKVSSMDFIGPRFSPKTTFLQLDPNTATSAQILCGLRQFAKVLLNGDTSYTEILDEEEFRIN
jgi:ADP-heptose:LPS heptosyltransferase